MVYIALLRGVNVASKNILNMKDLVYSLEKHNYRNVRTYIQSGNIIFELKNKQVTDIAGNIENMIKKDFNKSVKVIIRSGKELEIISNQNPFIRDIGIDISKLHVTFLNGKADQASIPLLEKFLSIGESYKVLGKEVYLYCPNGYGKTKLNNTNIEKKFNTIATTRNWNTIQNLLKLVNLNND
jgi:uncharacterized protein (DUF1697 family)